MQVYSRLAEMVVDGEEGRLIGCYSRVIINKFKICQIVEIGFIHVRQESFEVQQFASLRPNKETCLLLVPPKMPLGVDNILTY